MSNHPVRSEFEDYVQGLLGPEATAAFEAHVARCDACSAALSREAAVELALEEVAEQARSRPVPIRRLAMRRPLTLGFAAAAAAVLIAVPSLVATLGGSGHGPHDWISRCAQNPTDQCVARADEEGIFLRAAGASVPRYDEDAAEPILFPAPSFQLGVPQ